MIKKQNSTHNSKCSLLCVVIIYFIKLLRIVYALNELVVVIKLFEHNIMNLAVADFN